MATTWGTGTTVPSQTATYTSGSSDTFTPSVEYTVTTSKDGYSFNTSTHKVTVTNNTSTSARNGYVVTVTARGKTGTNSTYESGYNKTATSARIFNQAAGSIVYNNPIVTQFTYGQWNAVGYNGDDGYPIVKYSQEYTWNGVSGSGATYTYTYDANHTNPGGSRSFTTTGTLPSGFSLQSDYSTTGRVSWIDREDNLGPVRDAKNNLIVTVTVNGKTSSSYTCTSCPQEANVIERIYMELTVPDPDPDLDVDYIPLSGTYTMNYNDSFPLNVYAVTTAESYIDVTNATTFTHNPTGIVSISL